MKYWVLLFASCMLGHLVACDYATREELTGEVKAVDSKVQQVAQSQVSTVTRFGYAISAQQSRIEWVETRQRQSEYVLEAMGDGFNVLTESIEETQSQTERVEQRQSNLEKRVDDRFAPALRKAFEQAADGRNDLVVLQGVGEDLRLGLALPTLRLILEDPPILRRIVGENQYVEFVPTREMGDRLYGLSENPEESLCLEIVDRSDASPAFTAVNCSDPFHVYYFRVE